MRFSSVFIVRTPGWSVVSPPEWDTERSAGAVGGSWAGMDGEGDLGFEGSSMASMIFKS